MSERERDEAMPDPELVCVFRAADERLVDVVRSVLDREGIRHVGRSAELQELFGEGGVDGRVNFADAPIDFLVSRDDVERARDVLGALRKGFLSRAASEPEDL